MSHSYSASLVHFNITYDIIGLFWVSSLAYPNLLGTKVVVVVVVVGLCCRYLATSLSDHMVKIWNVDQWLQVGNNFSWYFSQLFLSKHSIKWL
jgi:hypothetical protein